MLPQAQQRLRAALRTSCLLELSISLSSLQAQKGATMASLLEFKNVTKVYSRGVLSKSSTTALNNVSMMLEQDEPTIMTVAGESGSGKTTLAMLLLGFITPTSGQTLYKGQ